MKPAILFLCLSCALASGQPLPEQSDASTAILARIGTNRVHTNYWVSTKFPKINPTNYYSLWQSTNQGKLWTRISSNLLGQSITGDVWRGLTNRLPIEWLELRPQPTFLMRRFLDDVPHPVAVSNVTVVVVNGVTNVVSK
jgi:hypothetical protein